MRATAWIGLLIGVIVGCWLTWANWPAEAELTQGRVIRIVGGVFAAGLAGWLVGELLRRIRSAE